MSAVNALVPAPVPEDNRASQENKINIKQIKDTIDALIIGVTLYVMHEQLVEKSIRFMARSSSDKVKKVVNIFMTVTLAVTVIRSIQLLHGRVCKARDKDIEINKKNKSHEIRSMVVLYFSELLPTIVLNFVVFPALSMVKSPFFNGRKYFPSYSDYKASPLLHATKGVVSLIPHPSVISFKENEKSGEIPSVKKVATVFTGSILFFVCERLLYNHANKLLSNK